MIKQSFRKYNLYKKIIGFDHILDNFSCGNKESIFDAPKRQGINTFQELIDFYHQHYYAENMDLVVLTHKSMKNEVEKAIVEKFSLIPSI